jgi:hypothetical protein
MTRVILKMELNTKVVQCTIYYQHGVVMPIQAVETVGMGGVLVDLFMVICTAVVAAARIRTQIMLMKVRFNMQGGRVGFYQVEQTQVVKGVESTVYKLNPLQTQETAALV